MKRTTASVWDSYDNDSEQRRCSEMRKRNRRHAPVIERERENERAGGREREREIV